MLFFVLKQCVCKRAQGRCLKFPAAGFLFGRISIRINSPSLELLDIYYTLVDPLFQLLEGALYSVILICRTFSHSAFFSD